MKTQFTLLALVAILTSATSIAAPARYSVPGKCYVVFPNSQQFKVLNIGSMTGLSNSDCDEANENLAKRCLKRARQSGHSDAVVYKDILILAKESGSSTKSSESKKRQAALLGLLWAGEATSVTQGYSEYSKTQVNYVPVNPTLGADCKFNPRYHKQAGSTLDAEGFGT
jgi:hypothetical protein